LGVIALILTAVINLFALRSGAAKPAVTTGPTQPDPVARARVNEAYGQLPLQFEANHGQTEEQVKFLARGSGYTLFLTATEAVLSLRMVEKESRNEQAAGSSSQSRFFPRADLQSAIRHSRSAVLRMQLAGAASAEPQISGREELTGKVNYFIGHDPTKWRTDIPTYARVHYREVSVDPKTVP
jgi:hypothetical protein